MRHSVLARKDVVAGTLFIVFGIIFGTVALDYGVGHLQRFKPGFFPLLVSSLLVVVGVFNVFKGLRAGGDSITAWSPRVMVIVLAVVVFALLIRPLGLFLTVGVTSLIASAAGHHRFGWQAFGLAIFLCVATWLVFDLMLNFPFLLFPAFLDF